ncbi:hypothetical protein EI77_00219 [Prosthecobacter fusiformis]|uniref:Uncharacterized protein n=1 Tax=Prosthecobacter fusiformis TaxID=48464 RepID=A0A4R7SRX3_9BACT|nr:hypothetical protein [Prosthecobacter fusiformis]TDU80918.1 hypothetical protein EI77_00219 [Prosthecobacter fusiformis]
MDLLERIAGALEKDGAPIRLCLIGSVACVFGGMMGRTSRDLDVWRPASDYDRLELRRAVEAAGMLFDPKSSLEPGRPYLQIVDPGPTQVGEFEPVLMERMGRLEIYRPPIEHLIASKLVRGDARDIEDVVFLAGKHQPEIETIRDVVETFSQPAKQQALENLVYLDIIQP